VQLAARANFILHTPCIRRCADTPQTVNAMRAEYLSVALNAHMTV
jgi:hypothetical protein